MQSVAPSESVYHHDDRSCAEKKAYRCWMKLYPAQLCFLMVQVFVHGQPSRMRSQQELRGVVHSGQLLSWESAARSFGRWTA